MSPCSAVAGAAMKERQPGKPSSELKSMVKASEQQRIDEPFEERALCPSLLLFMLACRCYLCCCRLVELAHSASVA
ncbi:hypothetical protein BDA96_01G062800 [Sorghum bicolor]|uniref:Uncharacterized protein n=2 Tax=Sorghum bicolor TaxID=4558 RepID=A0A921UXQ3_SORBI|nr:hypothetical protein BDA96_01G062800 [Sorghum bicolor]KXG37382.1 hypothetical protein SORBI_3001G061300 [Sorghum bicolor]